MAQQSVTGSEEPGLSTVLASTLRVKWFRSANSHTGQQLNAASQAGQMAAADYAPLQLPLASIGASTDGKRTCQGVTMSPTTGNGDMIGLLMLAAASTSGAVGVEAVQRAAMECGAAIRSPPLSETAAANPIAARFSTLQIDLHITRTQRACLAKRLPGVRLVPRR